MTFRELKNQLNKLLPKELDKSIVFYMYENDTEYLEGKFKHTKNDINLSYKFGDNKPYIEIGY